MLRIIFTLILFVSFGWFGSTQVRNENINLETFTSYVQQILSGSSFVTETYSLDQFFVQLGVNFFIPNSNELDNKTKQLTQDISNYCTSLETDPTSSENQNLLLIAQKSWKDSSLSYHKILSVPFGPIYDNSREIANNIYSWPLMYTCGMHVQMLAIKDTGNFDSKALYTSQGLMAVEFALFNDLKTTDCNNNKRFAKVHEWLSKSDEATKRLDLCKLALKSSEIVNSNTSKLRSSWSLEEGNYTFNMVNGSVYENFKAELNLLTDSMFYFEVAKDIQLGKPLGLHKDCLNTDKKCPDDIEHKWSQIGLDAIEMQFVGLNQIFNEGGFGQYLSSQGHEDIYKKAVDLNNSIIANIQNIKTLGTLNEQIETMNVNDCQNTTETNVLVPICGLQRQIRLVNHLFKSEILPALSLNAPLVFQGDAD